MFFNEHLWTRGVILKVCPAPVVVQSSFVSACVIIIIIIIIIIMYAL
jgi:hypothetical protein